MAYLCCLTDSDNKISFSVSSTVPVSMDKYTEFAKWVSNPHEKQAILTMLNAYTWSDVYLIFSLMDGELWTPYQTSESCQTSKTGIFETIEEPEISDPD